MGFAPIRKKASVAQYVDEAMTELIEFTDPFGSCDNPEFDL